MSLALFLRSSLLSRRPPGAAATRAPRLRPGPVAAAGLLAFPAPGFLIPLAPCLRLSLEHFLDLLAELTRLLMGFKGNKRLISN